MKPVENEDIRRNRLAACNALARALSELLGVPVLIEISLANMQVTPIRDTESGAAGAPSDSALVAHELQAAMAIAARPLIEIAARLGVDADPNIADLEKEILSELDRIRVELDARHDDEDDREAVLSDIIETQRKMRQHLDEELTAARMVINRIASALRLSNWDSAGERILERIHQVEKFRVVFMRLRRNIHREMAAADKACRAEDFARHKRLLDVLDPLWEVLDRPASTPVPGRMTRDVLLAASRMIDRQFATDERSPNHEWLAHILFGEICSERDAGAEFIDVVNLFVMPILERAKGAPADPEPPTG